MLMRLLSFLHLVEHTLTAIKPEQASGWTRRVNYQDNTAQLWNNDLGLALVLRGCVLAAEQSLEASWHDRDGAERGHLSIFTGRPNFDWQIIAENVIDLMPEPTAVDEPSLAATSARVRAVS